jgi:RHS repeat-associated protein
MASQFAETSRCYLHSNGKDEKPAGKSATKPENIVDGGAVDLQVDFKYDAFGNRIEKAHDADGTGGGSAVVTRFALDGWKNVRQPLVGNENWDVWADLDGSSSLTTRYVRGDVIDQLFARIEEDAGGDIPYWYLTDHLGSIRDVIDGSAVVKDSLTYDGFGNITAETDSNYRGRYAWTGREIDVEIELQYNRARYYDANTGRWITTDPIHFSAGDSNLYRYVRNHPHLLDGSGLSSPLPGQQFQSTNGQPGSNTQTRGLIVEPVSKPIRSANGNFRHRINWKLTEAAGAGGGDIIQLVERKLTVCIRGEYRSATYKFYETWAIHAAKTRTPEFVANNGLLMPVDDEWSLTVINPFLFSYNLEIRSTVWYVELGTPPVYGGDTVNGATTLLSALTGVTFALNSVQLGVLNLMIFQNGQDTFAGHIGMPQGYLNNNTEQLFLPWSEASQAVVDNYIKSNQSSRPVSRSLVASWRLGTGLPSVTVSDG